MVAWKKVDETIKVVGITYRGKYYEDIVFSEAGIPLAIKRARTDDVQGLKVIRVTTEVMQAE